MEPSGWKCRVQLSADGLLHRLLSEEQQAGCRYSFTTRLPVRVLLSLIAADEPGVRHPPEAEAAPFGNRQIQGIFDGHNQGAGGNNVSRIP